MGGVCTIGGCAGPACTDNFQIVSPPFNVAGWEFHSAEQAYQASKFRFGSVMFRAIAEVDPRGMSDQEFGMEVWQIGNSFRPDDGWDSVKVRSMYMANLCKFAQNPALAEELRSTCGKIVGAKSTWRWQFFNGQIMTQIRHLLTNGVKLTDEIKRVLKLDGMAVERELERLEQ